MKKLILKSHFSLILLIIITCYIFHIFNNQIYHTKYNTFDKIITGKILNYKVNGNKLNMEVSGKEKIIIYYTFLTEPEKTNFLKTIHLGDYYQFSGVMTKPPTNTNFNLFSYKNYLLSKKIYWIFKADKLQYKKESNSVLYNIKDSVYKYISKQSTISYFYTFILGDTSYLSPEIKQSYQEIGISHLMAISGMHISLVGIILGYIIRIKNKRLQLLFISLFLLFYAFLVGFTPSVVRACVMFIWSKLGRLFGWKMSSKKRYIILLYTFLLYNPFFLYHTGFLFSFMVSFFLVCTSFRKYKRYITKTFMISWLAFLVSIPILSYYYFEVNLLSPILNVFFVPFVSVIIFPLAIVGFFIPFLQPILAFLLQILERCAMYSDAFLSWTLILPKMPIYLIFLYYILLYIVIINKKMKLTILFLIFTILFSFKCYINQTDKIVMIDQTTPTMIQRISPLFLKNPLIIKEI